MAKTALIAALVLVHLVGPEAIQNGEIYSAASDREQAAQVFKVAAQMESRYTDALKQFEAVVAKNVTENIYDRHVKPVFVDRE